jgi:hypothetical protein
VLDVAVSRRGGPASSLRFFFPCLLRLLSVRVFRILVLQSFLRNFPPLCLSLPPDNPFYLARLAYYSHTHSLTHIHIMSCLSQKEDPPSPAASSNAMLLADLRRGWARPYTHSAFLKDLPRLVRRVRVETCDGVTHGPCCGESESESEGGGGGVGKAEAVLRLLEVVSAQLRVEETAVRALRLRLDRCVWQSAVSVLVSVLVQL